MDIKHRRHASAGYQSPSSGHWYNLSSPTTQYAANNVSSLNWRQSLGKILVADNGCSLSLKCSEIEKICSCLSSKELVEAFPYVLNDVFEFNNSIGWGLNRLEPRRYPTDYQNVYQFMSPNGCLFKLIDRLLAENEAGFQFPLTSFPAGVIELIEKGTVPLLYANKITAIDVNTGVVCFNAFEYYFVLFVHYIAQQAAKQTSNWSATEDLLYIRLLEDYLRHFFPTSVLTPSPNVKFNENTLTSFTKSSSKFSLWKSPEPSSQQNSWTNYSSPESFTDPGRSEVLLQILTDFWLCINRQSCDRQDHIKLPSVDHARVVRILIKYFHTYMNCTQDKQGFANENSYQFHLGETPRTFVNSILYPKLYLYFKDCFLHWPLDGSFRMVLETWLSFIQPWRYVSSEVSMNESMLCDVSQWSDFIIENKLFYTNLFRMFTHRALRLEMKSPLSMQLIYRVAKVFSQSNLVAVLREAVSSENRSHRKHHRLSPSNASFGGSSMYASLTNRPQFENDEVTIFDENTSSMVHALCESLASTCIDLQKELSNSNTTKSKRKGFWERISDFFMLDDDFYGTSDNLHEERLIEYLEQSCVMLCTIYEFPSFNTKLSNVNTAQEVDDVSFSDMPRPTLHVDDDGVTPEFVMTKDGVKLTDRGREQILRRLRHFEFCDGNDPELVAVKNYESKFLVFMLYKIATNFNEKYSSQLHTLYNRNDFISKTLRRISREVENTRFLDCSIKIPRNRIDLSEVKPRVSLRFLSSYYFLGYMFWMVVFARIFGVSWMSIIFIFILVLMVSVLVHIDSPPRIMQDEN